MFVLGTAGHVDHGKSSMLRALTGLEPDRLPEEKRRGMTVDLNFVWLDTRRGRVGIVDVPGHQRYCRNLISGVTQVDACLFVCAADDGWMPQSQEHLDILRGLGVRHGLGVVTKVDRVDPDRAVAVARELGARLRENLGECDVAFFSLERPERLLELREKIERLVEGLPSVKDRNEPRLWIDRVFLPRGLGVVVTGTLREGEVAIGDTLTLYPARQKIEVRGIQCYGKPEQRAVPVTRVALQLGGISSNQIERGMLLQKGEKLPLTRRCLARVEPRSAIPVGRTMALHLGTCRVGARLAWVEGSFARLWLTEAIPARSGDRFLLRTWGEETGLGAGIIVDPSAESCIRPRVTPEKWDDTAGGWLDYVAGRYGLVDPDWLAESSVYARAELEELFREGWLAFPDGRVRTGDWSAARERLQGGLRDGVKTREELARIFNDYRGRSFFSRLLSELLGEGAILREGQGFALPRALSPQERQRRQRIRQALETGVPSSLREIEAAIPGAKPSLLSLVKEGQLVALGDEHFVAREAFDACCLKVERHLKERKAASTSELREFLQISRKHAVYLLERMDRDKLTYLKDGVRRLFR